jgi:hypothetical protein
VLVFVALLGATSYQACAVYNSSLIGSPDGGDGDSPDVGAAVCVPALPPARPQGVGEASVTDNELPDADNIMVVAALRTIDIGVSGSPDAGIPPFGYDLDTVCTCPGPPSCVQQKNAPETCDDDAGRDNTDIQLFRDLSGPASAGTNEIDQGLTAGQFGLLVVITNYNGQSDDPAVTVDFYVSNGVNRSADGGIPAPNFDGNDHWTIDPGSIVGGQPGGPPVYSDPAAYVTGGSLVAHLSQLPIAFGNRSFLGGARMQLYEAVIVGSLKAEIVGDSGALRFALQSGTIAGRWPTSYILTTLASIPQQGGGYLCGNDSLDYQIIKAVVCSAADISSLSNLDNMNAPCDAISVGMQFTAAPAQLGDVLMVNPAPAGCQDSGIPWTDQCSQ